MKHWLRSLGGLGLAGLWACSSTSPELRATVVRSTEDLDRRVAEAPGFLRTELGRLGDARRSFGQLFLPEPARVRVITSPLVREAITREPQRLEAARRSLLQLSDTDRFGLFHDSVTALAQPRRGATSLSLALELQRTSDACRTFTDLLRRTQGALRRVDLEGEWPTSPLQEWLAILLK